MGWFKRLKDGIITSTKDKKEAPDGLWYKCTKCKEASTIKEVKESFHKCPKCNYHIRIGSFDYYDLIFDGKYEELFSDLISTDFLDFSDLKPYNERLTAAKKKTGLDDSMSVAVGKVNKRNLVIAAMDFTFIGGEAKFIDQVLLLPDYEIFEVQPIQIP